MNLNSWLVFAAIVDLGGLSEASRRLGVPKSTLSRRLAKLEVDAGARLLSRRGRTLALTDAGRLLYEEARQLADRFTLAQARLSEKRGEHGGTIRMTAPRTPGGAFLGGWLAQFLKLHSGIRVELDLDDRVISLHEQGYDLALRVGPLADSSLVARPLGISDRLLVASPEFTARHGRPASPAQLADLSCIGFGEQRGGYGTWTLNRMKRTERFRFVPRLRCDDMATTFRACVAGAGVALIPTFVCRGALDSGELERILPAWRGPQAPFFLVYTERKLLPTRLRLLIEFLVNCAKSGKWQF